jgi:hypothetical protein
MLKRCLQVPAIAMAFAMAIALALPCGSLMAQDNWLPDPGPQALTGQPPLNGQDIEFFIGYYDSWAAFYENGSSAGARAAMTSFLSGSSLSGARKYYAVTKVNTIMEIINGVSSQADITEPYFKYSREERALVNSNMSRLERAQGRLLGAMPVG